MRDSHLCQTIQPLTTAIQCKIGNALDCDTLVQWLPWRFSCCRFLVSKSFCFSGRGFSHCRSFWFQSFFLASVVRDSLQIFIFKQQVSWYSPYCKVSNEATQGVKLCKHCCMQTDISLRGTYIGWHERLGSRE